MYLKTKNIFMLAVKVHVKDGEADEFVKRKETRIRKET